MFPFFNHYPGTDLHEIDLAYVLKLVSQQESNIATVLEWKNTHEEEYEELKNTVDGLVNNLVDVIVPWDSSIAYRIFSIVEYQGANYIAVQDVPIGTMITNTDYWQPSQTVVEQVNAISLIVEDVRDDVEHLKAMFGYINIKDYGAVGDKTTDDSAAIKSAIADAKTAAMADKCTKVVYIPGGVYRITETIEIPYPVHLLADEPVIILVDFEGVGIWYNSGAITMAEMDMELNADTKNGSRSFNMNYTIHSNSNFTILRKHAGAYEDVNNDAASVGLKIGDDTYGSTLISAGNARFSGVNIVGFGTALRIMPVGTFLLWFDGCNFEFNRKNVHYYPATSNNQGENITFDRCVFGHSYNAFYCESEPIGSVKFNDCSFDFNGNVLYTKGLSNVQYIFNGCHIEGIGFNEPRINSTADNTDGFGHLVYVDYESRWSHKLISLSNCFIHLNNSNYGELIYNNSDNYDTVEVDTYGINLSYNTARITRINKMMVRHAMLIQSRIKTTELWQILFPYIRDCNIFAGLSGSPTTADLTAHGLSFYNEGTVNRSFSDGTLSSSMTNGYESIIKRLNVQGCRVLYATANASSNVTAFNFRLRIYDSNDNLLKDYSVAQPGGVTDTNGYVSTVANYELPAGASYVMLNMNPVGNGVYSMEGYAVAM